MNKPEFVEKMRECGELSKFACNTAIDAMSVALRECIEAGVPEISLPGLMKVYVADIAPRKRRNPKTGIVEDYPASKVVKCKLSGNILNAVKRGNENE